MDGSYNLSPEGITDESWQEFVDWHFANPVDMGTEAMEYEISNDASTNKARLTHYLLQFRYGDGYTYTKTTCATCSSELNKSELALYTKDQNVYCSKGKSHNHPPLSCVQDCGLNFRTLKDLKEHCKTTNHEALHCPVPECYIALGGSYHLKTHHGATQLSCHQCEELFENTSKLDYHASRREHSAYICRYPDCESIAGRFSDLIRHQACHKKDVPRHPCPHCRTYRGNNGFKRKDHLRQHISNFHKIESNHTGDIYLSPFLCKHINCRSYAAMIRQNFRSLDSLTQHMLTEHNSSAFTCEKMSCDRVGLNGFETRKLFQDHIKKEHPSPFQCTHPGCDRIGSKGWLRERDQKKHMFQKHGISV